MAIRFKEGMAVKLNRFDFYSGIPEGATGTVGKVATIGGKSIYPDPMKLMVFVNFDDNKYPSMGIPKGLLEKA
jgi:hypothetical protein